ncbi:MAG: preprotein translocase subunit SecE [Candidatus Makana argininalis]
MIFNIKKKKKRKSEFSKWCTIIFLLFLEPLLNVFFKKHFILNIKIIKTILIFFVYFIVTTTYKFKCIIILLNNSITEIINSIYPSFKETLIITLIILFLTIIISVCIFLLDNIILNILYFL